MMSEKLAIVDVLFWKNFKVKDSIDKGVMDNLVCKNGDHVSDVLNALKYWSRVGNIVKSKIPFFI